MKGGKIKQYPKNVLKSADLTIFEHGQSYEGIGILLFRKYLLFNYIYIYIRKKVSKSTLQTSFICQGFRP
ncbi:hypothetical protein TNCV_3441421 [Trichonephila clavipes]|uniref:Uncharacterized protein n=1 Tax=Trichonephila clavipes TaxID=2585209 RepID=A0A8X6W5R2_TRICX|nr:hypothetical protein TNCV_3441421 [Trichonephila clavipes]